MQHWKKTFNPNYLGSYAFEPGEEMVVMIERMTEETVTNTSGKQEIVLVAHLRGQKPLILNKTNCRIIEKLYGTPDIEKWPGKSLILCVQKISAGGDIIDAVRVRPVKPYECADCGGPITGYGGRSHGEIRKYTREKYGKQLCAGCAAKAAEGK